MKNFMEILEGIPSFIRTAGFVTFSMLILYISYLCIQYLITGKKQYERKQKKIFWLITVVISAELVTCYCCMFHSELKLTGLDQFITQKQSVIHSAERNDKKTPKGENEVVSIENDEFSIEDSDSLELADIVSGEVSLQEIDETENDIWYQYILIPDKKPDEAIAVGSYHDIIVTSRCSDLGWYITIKENDGS